MISYHLYLVYLVFTSEKNAGLSLPIVHTILTHVACVALVVLLAMGRHYIPFFGIIRLLIPAVAPFEADWLFSGGKKKAIADFAPALALAVPEIAAATPAPVAVAAVGAPIAAPLAVAAPAGSAPAAPVSAFSSITAMEYEEFLDDLRAGKRPFRKPGITVREEFERWHGARVKKRQASPAGSPSA